MAVLSRDLQPRHGCWPYTIVLSSTSQVVALLESPFPRGFAWFKGVLTRPGLAAKHSTPVPCGGATKAWFMPIFESSWQGAGLQTAMLSCRTALYNTKRSAGNANAKLALIDPHARTHLKPLVQLLAEHQLQDLAVGILEQSALFAQVAPAEQMP